jgi:hypothetical protein
MARWSFTEHPASVNETYGQHLASASYFGCRMVLAGLACLVHGLVPFAFVRTGSETIRHLHDRMITHRRRNVAVTPESRPSEAARNVA